MQNKEGVSQLIPPCPASALPPIPTLPALSAPTPAFSAPLSAPLSSPSPTPPPLHAPGQEPMDRINISIKYSTSWCPLTGTHW